MRCIVKATLVGFACCAATYLGASALDRIVLVCPGGIEVVDGDTVKCRGHLLRLEGLQAPEIRSSACVLERAKGLKARQRLARLLHGRIFVLPTGYDGCFGRWTTRPKVGGRDVGELLKEQGLAVDGPASCEKDKKHDWCGSGACSLDKPD